MPRTSPQSSAADPGGPVALGLEDLLRTSPSLASALPGVERAAASAAPILIVGEPGTGRSALARACHLAGPSAGGPLVEVDPGSIPASLFESELFGYRAGAFSGATTTTAGRIERAAGGTVVLDHLEELPVRAQPKLLQLLAERRFTPLGGAEQKTDARFLALASEDLPERIANGSFREDLYYRLAVLTFRLPPLRERRPDIPGLIDHFLADLGERFARPALELAPTSYAWMVDYSWPGNLRELRNVLERALILTRRGKLAPPPPRELEANRPLPLVELEAEQIRRALAFTRGHQGEAARLLGISRKSLWEKRKRYGIP